MKKLLLILLLTVPATVLAQKGYVELGPSVIFKDKAIWGANLNANFKLNNEVGIGAGINPYFLDKSVYLPLYGNLRFYLAKKRTIPFVELDPGYGFYHSSTNVSGVTVDVNGGFYFKAAIGFIMASKSKATAFIDFNYTRLTLNGESSYSGQVSKATGSGNYFGISLGICFK